ncbi:hypothetical protein WS98_03580 [Burkholderia territorii]|nr:hypothetical protein WS98_03580 [Burkholderia territorii]KWF99013.1 hypothetical protein WT58_02275 [Burkholderia territorii]
MPKLQPSGANGACSIAAARGVQRALDMDDVTFSFAGQRGPDALGVLVNRQARSRAPDRIRDEHVSRRAVAPDLSSGRQGSGGASRSTACSPVANGVA